MAWGKTAKMDFKLQVGNDLKITLYGGAVVEGVLFCIANESIVIDVETKKHDRRNWEIIKYHAIERSEVKFDLSTFTPALQNREIPLKGGPKSTPDEVKANTLRRMLDCRPIAPEDVLMRRNRVMMEKHKYILNASHYRGVGLSYDALVLCDHLRKVCQSCITWVVGTNEAVADVMLIEDSKCKLHPPYRLEDIEQLDRSSQGKKSIDYLRDLLDKYNKKRPTGKRLNSKKGTSPSKFHGGVRGKLGNSSKDDTGW
eukprot:GHVH01011017.1.p1 GENE.GHVH01011017.1~~GHVH01011017.1.p1  ORF type:complete len:256 (+),score=25.59 GHVH01011017.1:88-855(+)